MKWERKTINEVCNVGDGAHASIKRTTEGFQYLTSKNFKLDGLDLNKVDFISEVDYFKHFRDDSKAITKPKSNDVLLSIIGSLGAPYLVKEEDVFGLSSSVSILRPKNEIIEPRFLFYWIKSNEFQSSINNIKSGVAQSFLSLGMIKSLPVIYPKELPTQRKIASILSAYDDLIENNLKRIKLLEEKASLMYKLMQKELSDVEKINLYDFANIQMGFAFKAEAFNVEGEGIPIIRIRDIPAQMTKSHTTQEVDNQYWVEKGDLLIGMDGEFHMNEWLGQRGYLVQRVCRLRAKNELYQSYLWQALKEPIHYYETTISGATVAHLGKKHLEEIFIASPKDSMKNELEEMNVMRKLKIVLAEQNTKLREARDILLPKLMNGQIEV